MGILAQILENLTNFYFGSDFVNCTNIMWSITSLEEGPISQKLQKFKHHDFIFKVSTPRRVLDFGLDGGVLPGPRDPNPCLE